MKAELTTTTTTILVLLTIVFAMVSSFDSLATGNTSNSSAPSRSYPLQIGGYGVHPCPTYECADVQIVSVSPKNITGILYGNSTNGWRTYAANSSVSIPAGQTVLGHLVFSVTSFPGCSHFEFVVLAVNGTKLSDLSQEASTCGISNTALTAIESHCASLSGLPVVATTYRSNVELPKGFVVVVDGVVHNSVGQTVYYTTASVFMPLPNATVTAYLAFPGLNRGNYSISTFVVTPSGVAISWTVTLSCLV